MCSITCAYRTQIALEAIENIRTVAALTREIKFQEMYNEALEKPFRYEILLYVQKNVHFIHPAIYFTSYYWGLFVLFSRNSQRKAYIFGVAFAVSQSLIYFCFGTAFLFGAFLIEREEMTFNGVFM